jgi:hypothetical protein
MSQTRGNRSIPLVSSIKIGLGFGSADQCAAIDRLMVLVFVSTSALSIVRLTKRTAAPDGAAHNSYF